MDGRMLSSTIQIAILIASFLETQGPRHMKYCPFSITLTTEYDWCGCRDNPTLKQPHSHPIPFNSTATRRIGFPTNEVFPATMLKQVTRCADGGATCSIATQSGALERVAPTSEAP